MAALLASSAGLLACPLAGATSTAGPVDDPPRVLAAPGAITNQTRWRRQR